MFSFERLVSTSCKKVVSEQVSQELQQNINVSSGIIKL